MLVPDERNRPESVIQTGNNPEDDSTEPTNIYKIIEKMYPNHKYLDLFAGAANSNIDWDKCYDTNGRDILESHYEKISKAIRRFKNDCR
jgi:N6-adenosine-specific RNA methylase IME4